MEVVSLEEERKVNYPQALLYNPYNSLYYASLVINVMEGM